ncbi:efflux RND transporter permease subunit [Parahaliea aestuarii]|uniref:efflux RND transporter permease subunit n=1 Tax=Parahaliea aestuarii TaxID=1852021 RepID=UPI001C9BFB58|nr:efflux RND transporter permease subunit [Parahaliea aestuarii]
MSASQFFGAVIRWRWPILILSLLCFLAIASQAPKLSKNTRSDAFIDPQDPALLDRDRVEALFNINDPIVVAVVNEAPGGIFNPQSLALVDWITRRLQQVDNIDPDQVTSLATEANIVGTEYGMEVEDFFATAPSTAARSEWMRNAIDNFPLYQGNLVGREGKTTLVVAELLDEDRAADTYEAVVDALQDAPLGAGDSLHVAGEGAVAGYLQSYIDNDAKRLNPLAAVIITVVLFVALRTLRGMLIPNLIVILTAGSTIGAMAAFGVNFYTITNGLIVCMIGIAVADSVHIFSQYYEEIALDPGAPAQVVTLRAMVKMWQPVTLTTFTTIAGFSALSATTTMPPVFYFGLFGALAVFLAWLYSMTTLPALLSLLKPKASRAFSHQSGKAASLSVSSRLLARLGDWVLRRPYTVAALGLVLAGVAGWGAFLVEANEERIANFKSSEPIYHADKTINALTDGTYHLDIMVESPDPEGLYQPQALRKIEQTQRYLEGLPHVGGTVSIVDYIKQMHKAVNEDQAAYYTIPDDPQLVAQLFLLYSASGDPTEFEDEIDSERRFALIRASVDENKYSNNKVLVPLVQQWLDESYAGTDLKATVTGDINVSYHWINPIVNTNLMSVLVCIAAVIVMSALLFRSGIAGAIVVVPVALSILLVYAVMGFAGVWLGVGTSMFASIAIGLGVDFAVHTTHSIRTLLAERSGSWEERLRPLFPTTGRAQLFNFLAISLGFSVLITSDVPPLIKFGSLVAVAVASAFFSALLLLPALALLIKPRFLSGGVE